MTNSRLSFLFTLLFSVLLIFQNCSSGGGSTSTTTTLATGVPAVYIYSSDLATAQQFQTLLNANGYNVTLVTMSNFGSINFSQFSLVIISSDSASSEPWGGFGSPVPSSIVVSGVPVLGIGVGGAMFFDTVGANSIGWGQSASVAPVNTVFPFSTSGIWSSPYALPAGAQIVASPSGAVELYYPGGAVLNSATILQGEDPIHPNYFSIATFQVSGPIYGLWGFTGLPKDYTVGGQQLFVNLARNL